MICGGTIEDSPATATSIALGDKSPTYSRVFVLGLDFFLLSTPWRLIPAPASLPNALQATTSEASRMRLASILLGWTYYSRWR